MTARPILFSAPMIKALLAGQKTQTRRIVKPRAKPSLFDGTWTDSYVLDPGNQSWRDCDIRIQRGDTLWVRESVQAVVDAEEFDAIRYLADGHVERSRAETAAEADRYAEQLYGYRRRKGAPDRMTGVPVPSIHMPRWASRLTLTVSEVRVERLQDITEEDAIAEGITCENVIVGMACYGGPPVEVTADRYFFDGCDEEGFEDAVSAYAALWDSINGFGAWAANPWVTATTFAVARRNIDAEG